MRGKKLLEVRGRVQDFSIHARVWQSALRPQLPSERAANVRRFTKLGLCHNYNCFAHH